MRPRSTMARVGFLVTTYTAGSFAQERPRATLAALDPRELDAVRGVVDRGAVVISRHFDDPIDASATVYVHVHAPLAAVRHAITAAEEYPTFLPEVAAVEVLSRRAGRAAFRVHANAAVLDVSVVAELHEISERRVDFVIDHSDLGSAGTRWDLVPAGPADTFVAASVWSDTSSASWMVQQLTGGHGRASDLANFAAGTTLALAVKRRAETLSGSTAPVRPPMAFVRDAPVDPPADGPWLQLTRTVNVAVLTLDAEGALVSVTAAGFTSREPLAALRERLVTPEAYGRGWTWLRRNRVLERSVDRVRFEVTLGAPLAGGRSEWTSTRDPNGTTVRMEGLTGDQAGERAQWDFVSNPDGFAMMVTGGTDALHLPWAQRLVLDRDPWAAAGVTAYWKVLTLRRAFIGV